MKKSRELDCQDWHDEEKICQVYFIEECKGNCCIGRAHFPKKCKECKSFALDDTTICKSCYGFSNFEVKRDLGDEETKPKIRKDCKWYALKDVSLGDLYWCLLFDEELILDANDCVTSECNKYKARINKI